MSRNAKPYSNLLDSLNRLTGKLLPFIAPVVSSKQKICTVQFGKAHYFSLPESATEPSFCAGWYLLGARDKNIAGVERRTFPIERMEYLRQLPRFSALTLYPINGGYLALRLNPSFPDQLKPFPVYLTGEMTAPLTPFTVTIVRQLGQTNSIYLYDTTVNDRDNDLIQGKLLDAIHSGGNIHSFPGVYMKTFSLVKEVHKTVPIDTLNLQPVWYGEAPQVTIPGLCLTGEQYDLPTIITVMSRKAA